MIIIVAGKVYRHTKYKKYRKTGTAQIISGSYTLYKLYKVYITAACNIKGCA